MTWYRGGVLAVALVVALFMVAGEALAADHGSITILSPQNGTVLNDSTLHRLVYEVHLGPYGNHLHIYIDHQSPIIVRDIHQCPCVMELPQLSLGVHTITVSEATASHQLTGVHAVVTVTVVR